MNKWIFGWYFILLWAAVIVWGKVIQSSLVVSPDADQCEDRGKALLCDYKMNEEDSVFMKPFKTESIKTVYLYNVRKLYLSKSVCVNVVLHNVGSVLLEEEHYGRLCNRSFEFTSRKSNMDGIPSNINKVLIEECKVKVLSTAPDLSSLSLVETEVKVFNVSGPLLNGTSALLKDSKIGILRQLAVGSGGHLDVQRSDITTVETGGLNITAGGSTTIKDISVKKVRFGPLVVEDFRGEAKIHFSKDTIIQEKMPVSTKEGCVYAVLFYLCLILLLFSWGFIYWNRGVLQNISPCRLLLQYNPVSGDGGYSSSPEGDKDGHPHHVEVENTRNQSCTTEKESNDQEIEKINELLEKVKCDLSFETTEPDMASEIDELSIRDEPHWTELVENYKKIAKDVAVLIKICEHENNAFGDLEIIKKISRNNLYSQFNESFQWIETSATIACKTKDELPGKELLESENKLYKILEEMTMQYDDNTQNKGKIGSWLQRTFKNKETDKNKGDKPKGTKDSIDPKEGQSKNSDKQQEEKIKTIDKSSDVSITISNSKLESFCDEICAMQLILQNQIKDLLEENIQHAKKTFWLLRSFQKFYLECIRNNST